MKLYSIISKRFEYCCRFLLSHHVLMWGLKLMVTLYLFRCSSVASRIDVGIEMPCVDRLRRPYAVASRIGAGIEIAADYADHRSDGRIT